MPRTDGTTSQKYKNGLLATVDRAYETRRLFLKEKCKTFTLQKEVRDHDFEGMGEREVLECIYTALVKKYKFGKDREKNRAILENTGFILGNQLKGQALHGQFVRTSSVAESTSYYATYKHVNTHKNGIQLLHSMDAIKTAIGMPTAKVKTILERLFRKGGFYIKKILALDTAEFYAFIINNEQLLKQEFKAVAA